ncbi:DUF7345 domain-containing protein [Halorubrum saccharovorum]|nr:DUF4897 domain-containing protein [Halorubrum saccharovorum]
MTDFLRNRSMTVGSMCVIGLLLTAPLLPMAAVSAAGQTAQPEADNTVTRIHVSPNGSAQWTIRIRTRLDTDDRVTEYEAFQERFRENKSRYLDSFRQRMQGVVANAANATGREMRAVNFTASTSIQEVPRRWGIVTYQFTWTGFAAQQNDSLAVGDVFQGGFFLAANDTLEMEAPTGYEISRAEPTPASRDDGVVTWVGREDFANRHPRVVFDTTTESQQPDQQSPSPDRATSSPFGDTRPGVVLGGVLLVTLVGIAAYVGWRRRDDSSGSDQPESVNEAGDADDQTQAPAGEDAPTDDVATGGAVLTDPERVQDLLEANGGRMRQAAIADEFDWSASKTSRVIGNMVDEGTIEKLQLGRENLIEFDDADE